MGNFLGKRGGETEEQEKSALSSPNAKKRKTRTDKDAPGAGVCDDVLLNIFARLPARAAVTCMALSKHHHRLICSPEFRSLHYRLGAPLPHPHIAYVVTRPIKRRPEHKDPVSMFHGFHVAGAGYSANAPMRSIVGATYLDTRYVNTCNGIVLLSNEEVSDTCRSKTYQLLMCAQKGKHCKDYLLVIYELGDIKKQPTVLAEGVDGEIDVESLYMDGIIYLRDVTNSVILAFDIDHETVTSISMPPPLAIRGNRLVSKLLELSGRPCVAIKYVGNRALWTLTRDHQWIRRCLIPELQNDSLNNLILGIWECGDVLVLYVENIWYTGYLLLYNVATDNMFRADMPRDFEPDWSEYVFCWGYRPTLVSPMSIVGKIKQDKEWSQERPSDLIEALVDRNEQDRKKGRKATLDIVRFMDFLVCLMRKLPHDMQDVVETKMMNSEKLLFEEAIPFEEDIVEVDY
ncbi:hypothetical protein EJB05_39507, partial [Eragrostis curvula]